MNTANFIGSIKNKEKLEDFIKNVDIVENKGIYKKIKNCAFIRGYIGPSIFPTATSLTFFSMGYFWDPLSTHNIFDSERIFTEKIVDGLKYTLLGNFFTYTLTLGGILLYSDIANTKHYREFYKIMKKILKNEYINPKLKRSFIKANNTYSGYFGG
ncbi:MAG: hypothetical protein ABIH65_03355 [Nanoarchaeota archaeon]